MQQSTRVNYDAIAERYDSTPHREKSADPELIAFLARAARGDRVGQQCKTHVSVAELFGHDAGPDYRDKQKRRRH